MEKLLEIICEDGDLLVVNKPAGLVCHPTKTDEYSSLISRARLYLGKDSHPQLVNRLDRETSGVTIIAKTAEAAREIRRLWEGRQVWKEYVALVHGHVAEEQGVIEAPLGPDEGSRVAIKDCVRPDGAAGEDRFSRGAPLRFSLRRNAGGSSPAIFTAARGAPHGSQASDSNSPRARRASNRGRQAIWGRRRSLSRLGKKDRLTPEQRRRLILPNHALHAREVSFSWRENEMRFQAKGEGWCDWPRSARAEPVPIKQTFPD